MKDLDILTLIAVFAEMLGWTLWPIIAAAALALIGFVIVLLRDRGFVATRLVGAELAGLLGGAAAVAVMFYVTNSGFDDLGGPIDWLLVLGIFLAGGFWATIGSYAAIGLLGGKMAAR